ncbi:polyphosphate polymerase domain-containing protein [Arabiibacter massiliensis]|uniref:polyphosphate polymerase domain-containing protein n=1 Tax=Arabiibacter massiliensis TaxID=1870985 RepID=UPI0009B99AFD|nr:polyphosphate polymerase domain-containing protein [Arabiibacter massiliensis]
MATFTDVFERKEVKYRLSARQGEEVRRALADRLAPDEYGRTSVRSLYLDTPERALIERSLDKPLYKEKLRLRSYGAPADDGLVFVEIKKKFKGIVYKRRVGCSYAAARAYLGGVPYEEACARFPLADPVAAAESLAPRSRQIAAEIDQCMARHAPLVSSMLIRCERVAYAPVLDALSAQPPADVPCDLRITFDERIAYRDLFAPGSPASPLLRAGEAVMEIKASGPFPLWLVRALDASRIYPTSFSKYGEAYRACMSAPASAPAPARAIPIHPAKKGGRCA